jgi:MFS family permease
MAFVEDPGLLLAIGFLTAVVETPFWSASQAAIPNLVGKDDLAWANGLLQVGANAGIMLGPAVGGVLLAALGAGMVFGLNALSFVLSALIVATVRGRFSEDRSEHEEQHRGLRAGFVFIAHDRILRILVLAWTVFVFGIGMVMVADVPLVEEFGTGATGYGLLIGCWGAGSVLGSLAGRKLNERIEPRALFVGTAVIGVTTAGVALSPWFPPVLVLILLAGAADAVVMVADRSIQQRRTPDVVRSRVVSASESLITIALAAGFVLGGPALELLGPRGVYAAGGAFAFVGAVVLLPILRASRGTTEQPEPVLDEVVETPELVAAGATR